MDSYPVGLVGARVALRELRTGDTDTLHEIYGDELATRHLSFDPRSREQVELIVARSIVSARAQPRSEYALAVTEVSDDRLIGFARLATEEHQAATIGGALRSDRWRNGLGAEVVRLLLALAFDKLGLHRVWAARSPDNTAAEGVLRKVGMVPEGRIRHHVHTHGAWRDSITYSILDADWAAQH